MFFRIATLPVEQSREITNSMIYSSGETILKDTLARNTTSHSFVEVFMLAALSLF